MKLRIVRSLSIRVLTETLESVGKAFFPKISHGGTELTEDTERKKGE